MVNQPTSFQTMLAAFRKLRAQGLQKHTMLPIMPHFDFLQPMLKMMTRFGCSSAKERASIIDEDMSGNTKRATGTWVRAFSEYCSDLNLKTCAASELAPKLEGFYADLRKQDGSVYKRASYIAAQGALQRHLTYLDPTLSIYKDKEFVKANSVLDGVLKQNKKSGPEEGAEDKRALSAEDWDLVQEYFKKVSTSSNPVSLRRYVWFGVSLHFCLRGREIQSQLNKCDLVFGKMKTIATSSHSPRTSCQKITNVDSRGEHFRPPAASPIPSKWRLFAATLITSIPAANDYSNRPESPHSRRTPHGS